MVFVFVADAAVAVVVVSPTETIEGCMVTRKSKASSEDAEKTRKSQLIGKVVLLNLWVTAKGVSFSKGIAEQRSEGALGTGRFIEAGPKKQNQRYEKERGCKRELI